MNARAGDKPRTELEETVAAFPDRSTQEIKKESNPFTDRDWRMLTYAWSGFLLRVLLILGGIFSVVQYMQARDEKRIERTLELVQLWEEAEYQTAQKALRARLDALNTRYAGLLGANATQEEQRVYRERIGIAAHGEDGGAMPLAEFREHFDRVVYFLNRVAFCVEGNLCKQSVADAYFRDYAASFWAYFAGYVGEQRRRGAPGYAAMIETWLDGGR